MKLIKKAATFSLLLSLLAGAAPVAAQADDIYTFIVKKQEEKKKYRWSIADWLETRDKMRLQDLWLALHSPSPYEFFFGAAYQFRGSSGDRPDFNSWRLNAAAYASIFGLEGERSFSGTAETLGLLSLRVFGFQTQGTNITLQAGLLSASEPASSRNGILGVRTTLYLTRYVGIEAIFRHLFPSTPNASGVDRQGNRLSATGFMDFQFLRVFGEYFRSSEPNYAAGFATGFRFFF